MREFIVSVFSKPDKVKKAVAAVCAAALLLFACAPAFPGSAAAASAGPNAAGGSGGAAGNRAGGTATNRAGAAGAAGTAASPAYSSVSGTPAGGVASATTERIANAYAGSRDYLDTLFNVDFQDAGSSWARDAIYEGGALGIIKGFGSAFFSGQTVMTKGEALALALRAAGLEAQAQLAGEALEAADRKGGKAPSGAEAIWMNGCFKIAADYSLISKDDYKAAIGDAASQAVSAFRGLDPAQRQEFANWLVRILDIPPVRGQQALFVEYADWKDADSLYAPYIEAALREKIMSGDPSGRLYPRSAITREQAAQMVKNASKFVLARNGFTETTGTIERIIDDSAAAPEGSNAELMRTVYYIRNQIGLLDTITTQIAISDSAGKASADRRETGLFVNDGGTLEDERVLHVGDRIRYISSKNRYPGYQDEIRYVERVPDGPARNYLLAQIDAIDAVNRRITFTQIFPVEYVKIGELRRAAEAPEQLLRLKADYIYSEDLAVISDGKHIDSGGKRLDAGILAPGMTVVVGIENFRNIFHLETVGFGYDLGLAGIARGVIEENNPVLGYISMYSESGDRTAIRSLGKEGGVPELMIYSYSDPASLDVRKDGFYAALDAIGAGDSAFVRFDEAGELVAVSAVSNYKVRFGTVASVTGNTLAVMYDGDSGAASIAELGADTLYFQDYRVVGKKAVVPGASVRVLLKDLAGSVKVAEITVMRENARGYAGNVYKAMLSRFDETLQELVLYNIQKLVKGKWEKVDRKGYDAISISAGTRVFVDGAEMTVPRANKMLRDTEVYVSVKKDYGGVEVAAQISVRGVDDKELLYDDVVRSVRRTAGIFGLTKGPSEIASDDRTIVVKDGLLISGAGIEQDDLVYVVASREDATGRLRAEVVEIGDRVVGPKIHIYRGRISNIAPNKQFTLESFAELELGATEWRYANTPKTFTITFNTLLLTAAGVAPIRSFDNRGVNDYTDPPRSVYVLSDGTNALAISTAPYGIENFRGQILSLNGLRYDDDGQMVSAPAGITAIGVSYYDRSKFAWTGRKGDAVIAFAPNTLIVKDGAPVTSAALSKSDYVRVIKAGAAQSGVGYIVIVEK